MTTANIMTTANNNTVTTITKAPAKPGLWQTTKGVTINSLKGVNNVFTGMENATAALAMYSAQLKLDAHNDLMESAGVQTAEQLKVKMQQANDFLESIRS